MSPRRTARNPRVLSARTDTTPATTADPPAAKAPPAKPRPRQQAADWLQVHVGYAAPRAGLPASASFRRWVAAALRGARRKRRTELAIRIVGNAEGLALNQAYRGRHYATNVLSFPAEPPPGVTFALIGDLAICAPVVQREAAEQGKAARDHWAHLTIHGVLHLLGYDHVEEGQAEVMEALETRILADLGIANPYG
jgi:probable rRNA maturation factor